MTSSGSCGIIAGASVSGWFGNLYDTAVAAFRPSLARDIREIVFGSAALPGPYREALILTEYQGLTQKEMAERLGISLSGVRSRVQRARQKVKDLLMTCCHFEFDARGLVHDYRQHCCCCASETSSTGQ